MRLSLGGSSFDSDEGSWGFDILTFSTREAAYSLFSVYKTPDRFCLNFLFLFYFITVWED